ncbi:protein of unknown function [Xenorhabdus doucetiae]|uniref:Uncharacterized protein n=1 Tax=Xenorhabdus doucetiae TaxID=351671 RepID=A0A068QQI3_9GAMM|nr:protein of unknown function [Xenorhabdus doucetiae]
MGLFYMPRNFSLLQGVFSVPAYFTTNTPEFYIHLLDTRLQACIYEN